MLAEGRDGLELLDVFAVAVQGHVVDPHQLARPGGALAVPPALGMAVKTPAALGLDAAQAHARGEDAPDGRFAQFEALASLHDAQPALAHERVPAAYRPNAALLAAAPAGALDVARAAASGGQPSEKS